MKIQIVIPSINLWNKYTKPCIDSIKTKHEYRIFLVDNASTDETKAEAGKLVSNTFSHRRNEERWSCAQSWNFAIKDAWERGFDYVLVLNNDVLLHSDAVDRMAERFEKEKSILILKETDIGNPTYTYNDKGELVKNGNDVITRNDFERQKSPVCMVTCMDVRGDCPNPTDIFNLKSEDFVAVPESEHPNFSAFMINKKCWDTIGEFDEGFAPAYFEDNDYHHRIMLAGLKAICYPPALFYHFGSRTQNEADVKPIVPGPAFDKNRDYFRGKWGGLPSDANLYVHPFDNDAFTIKLTKQNHG